MYYGGAALLHVGQPPMPEKHGKAGGAGGGIIDILEVVESDAAANLAKEETQESTQQRSTIISPREVRSRRR